MWKVPVQPRGASPCCCHTRLRAAKCLSKFVKFANPSSHRLALVDAPVGCASSVADNTFDAIGTFGVMPPAGIDAVHGNRFGAGSVAAVFD